MKLSSRFGMHTSVSIIFILTLSLILVLSRGEIVMAQTACMFSGGGSGILMPDLTSGGFTSYCVPVSTATVNSQTCYAPDGPFVPSNGVNVYSGSSVCAASTDWNHAYVIVDTGKIPLAPVALVHLPDATMPGLCTFSGTSGDYYLRIYDANCTAKVSYSASIYNPMSLFDFKLSVPFKFDMTGIPTASQAAYRAAYQRVIDANIAAYGKIVIQVGSITMIIPVANVVPTPVLTSLTQGASSTVNVLGSNFKLAGNTVRLTNTTDSTKVFTINNVYAINSNQLSTFTIPSSVPDSSYNLQVMVPSSAWSNSLMLTKYTKSDPTNLTISTSTISDDKINLSWKNTDNNVNSFEIERSFVGQSSYSTSTPFIVIGKTASSVVTYTDDLSITAIPRENIEYLNYRVRSLYSDGTYSNYATINPTCGSKLMAIYNRLPSQLTGEISIPYLMGQGLKLVGEKQINLIISALGLNGKGKNLFDVYFSTLPLLTSEEDIQIGDIMVKKIPNFVKNDALNLLPSTLYELGKKYNLNNDEVNELFSGIITNSGSNGLVNFTFNKFEYTPASIAFGGAYFTYDLIKGSPNLCASSDKNSIKDFVTVLKTVISKSNTPAPKVSQVKPYSDTPNTFIVSGSGFDSTSNLIKLTPVSPISMNSSSILQANSSSFFDIIWNFFKKLFTIAHGETISTTTATTTDSVYYINDLYSTDGVSLVFTASTSTPDGIYKVSVSGFNSDWTDTTYTITVTGNSAITSLNTSDVMPSTAINLGPISPDDTSISMNLVLDVKLDPVKQSALSQYLQDIYDPTSSNYHNYLTPDQYAQRYGRTIDEISTLTNWLSSNGFTNINPASSTILIDFTGTLGQLQSAFNITFNKYNVGTNVCYAANQSQIVPENIATLTSGFESIGIRCANPPQITNKITPTSISIVSVPTTTTILPTTKSIIVPTSKVVPATVIYTCSNGSTLSGTNCMSSKTNSGVSPIILNKCPSEYKQISKTKCSLKNPSKTNTNSNTLNLPILSCKSNYTLNETDKKCYAPAIINTTPAIPKYTCPAEYTLDLNTKTCTNIITSKNNQQTSVMANVWEAIISLIKSFFN